MSTPMTMMNCPDDNTLAAYLDGRLDPAARNRVVEHLSTCEDCYANASAVWDYQAESGGKVVKGQFDPPPVSIWMAATVAAIAASVSFVLVLPAVRDWIVFQRTGGMSAVIAAQSSLEERPTTGRLAGFPYKPAKRVIRGDKGEKQVELELLQMYSAAERLKSADSAKELRALGAAELFFDHREAPDAAIVALERAAAAAPRDPAVLNDRVVAYLARGEKGDDKRALELAQQAWQIEQTPEIAFNRALALELNGKTADAIRAWQEYLALDPSSQWAAEAQDKLKNLQNPDDY